MPAAARLQREGVGASGESRRHVGRGDDRATATAQALELAQPGQGFERGQVRLDADPAGQEFVDVGVGDEPAGVQHEHALEERRGLVDQVG